MSEREKLRTSERASGASEKVHEGGRERDSV